MKAHVVRAVLGAMLSIIAYCCPSEIRAEESDRIWESILAITVHTGISVEEIAAYLTLGRPPEASEPRLVRWDQADISLGLVVSHDTPAPLVESIIEGIQRRFESVNRRLGICVRSWPGGSDIVDGRAMPVAQCGPSSTEIDLMISVSETAPPSEIDALPSNPAHAFLTGTWSRIRQEILANPNWHFCNFGFATDAKAQKLVGVAGAIWVPPTSEKKTFELAENCSTNLGFYLLGSVPILDKPGGESGTLSPDILALLYSDQFESGQSRSEVLAILRAAQP